jgi:hypothetical protein
MLRVFLKDSMIIQPVNKIPDFKDYECSSLYSKRHEIEIYTKMFNIFHRPSATFLILASLT